MTAGTIALRTPRLQRLHADWDSRRNGREFPARADFTPFELKYMIGDLSLLDVERDPLRFRYRIHAGNLAQRLGYELTGKYLDQAPRQEHVQIAVAHLTEVLEKRIPVAHYRDHYFIDKQLPHDCEILVLPLARDGSNIDMLMSAFGWGVTAVAPDVRRQN